jgi:hypothetical protein
MRSTRKLEDTEVVNEAIIGRLLNQELSFIRIPQRSEEHTV